MTMTIPVHPADSLGVMTGVPAGVKDDDPIRSDQVHPEAARSRRHQEQFHLHSVSVLSFPCISQLSLAVVYLSTFCTIIKYKCIQYALFAVYMSKTQQTLGLVLKPLMSRSRSMAGVDPSSR